MPDISVYDYRLRFYDPEGRQVDVVDESIHVESTGDREDDRANANLQVYNLGDAYLKEDDAAIEFTVELTDVG